MDHETIALHCQRQTQNQDTVVELSQLTQIAPTTLETLLQPTLLVVKDSHGPWWNGNTESDPVEQPIMHDVGTWG